jgi:phospho-N-acetylmuramoyl-pentapeptide-transferase
VLPRCFKYLPVDRGKAFAVASSESKGKPTGAGVIFISICVLISLLVAPLGYKQTVILLLIMATMFAGYLDDKGPHPWNEYKKGTIDLVKALLASVVLVSGSEPVIWLPFTKIVFHPSPVLYVIIATSVIWISINITNCSDGVDGLSGIMVLFAMIGIGSFLYLVAGHVVISEYLLIPYAPESVRWAIIIFVFVGGVSGYLWYNAHPAICLMGDAGARALGFIVGVSVIVTGSPALLLVMCTILCANGGGGLVKVLLLRFFRISIFHNIRFPLHDHFRHVRKWSNAQVLVRFGLIQVLITLLLFGIMIKIR